MVFFGGGGALKVLFIQDSGLKEAHGEFLEVWGKDNDAKLS